MSTFFKSRTAALSLAILAASSMTATAGWNEFWHNVRHGYHRNNAWPQPFVEADTRATIDPFTQMKRNGWMLHNTISHDLFRDSDGVLLASGNQRVRWITNHAPEGRRQVFVMRGRDEAETQARLASVQKSIDSYASNGNQPEVLLTDRQPGSSSGAVAVKVNRDWLNAMPVPQLPSNSVSGTAGAASGN